MVIFTTTQEEEGHFIDPIYDATFSGKWKHHATARATIDEETEAVHKAQRVLEATRVSLANLHNQHIPMFTVPPEVLSSILLYAIQEDDPLGLDLSWSSRSLLSSVCRHWRAVALETPAFWVEGFSLRDRDMLPAMLVRSKSSPFSVAIDVTADEWYNTSSKTLKSVMSPQRLRRLRITRSNETAGASRMRDCIGFIPSGAPCLETLFLSSPHTGIRIPSCVMSSSMPALRHIHISSCTVRWSGVPEVGSILTNLETLSLQKINPPIPWSSLLCTLTASPKLSELKLIGALPAGPAPDSPTLHAMQLNHLTRMELQDGELPISWLLNHLDLPNLSHGSIDCTGIVHGTPSSASRSTRLAIILNSFGVGSQATSNIPCDTLTIAWRTDRGLNGRR